MEIKDKNGITWYRPEKEEAKILKDITTAFHILNLYVTITRPDGDVVFSEEFRAVYKKHINPTNIEFLNVLFASSHLLEDMLIDGMERYRTR